MDQLVMLSAASIIFRTDASVDIGTGHVMRCLTLADALRDRGAETLFICRPHEGHLLEEIGRRGHTAVALNRPLVIDPAPDDSAHATWLGAGWAQDAEETQQAIGCEPADWLIVDHYALDERWEKALRPMCRRLMVMDDLADRAHDCDLLLDPTYGRTEADYAGLLPLDASMLLGPEFALLRPDFARTRADSLARRDGSELRHLLVTMGGIDKSNATSLVLTALAACPLPPHLSITVVMGPQSPWLADVEQQAGMMRSPTRVEVGVTNMARLMADADLAVGAAGGTSWERCCLGLPTILLVLAENQSLIARTLSESGCALGIGSPFTPDFGSRFVDAFTKLCKSETRSAMARAASKITAGQGAILTADALLGRALRFREATESDAKRIWEWHEEGGAWRYYRSAAPIPWSDHEKWFRMALANHNLVLLIVDEGDEPKAHLRFATANNEASISIYIAPEYRGQGLGVRVLRAAKDYAAQRGWTALSAEVHEENAASRRIFEAAGFVCCGSEGPFAQFRCDLNAAKESQ